MASLSSKHAVQGNYGSIGGQAIYTDRPTITYVPMTGDKFLHGLVTPIDPRNIFFMLQAGYRGGFRPRPVGRVAERRAKPLGGWRRRCDRRTLNSCAH